MAGKEDDTQGNPVKAQKKLGKCWCDNTNESNVPTTFGGRASWPPLLLPPLLLLFLLLLLLLLLLFLLFCIFPSLIFSFFIGTVLLPNFIRRTRPTVTSPFLAFSSSFTGFYRVLPGSNRFQTQFASFSRIISMFYIVLLDSIMY